MTRLTNAPRTDRFKVSPHAIDRYREHYPRADEYEVRSAVCRSAAISASDAAALSGTPKDLDALYRLLVTGSHSGCFVLRHHLRPTPYWSVVTYLRLPEPAEAK